MWLMKWESRTTPLTCTETVQEREPRSPEVLCTFVCVNGWMRERGQGFEHVCCRSLCLCVCLCICIQCADLPGSACVCVLCVHSTQHTPRLWQTDSKPRNPHTPLPRLIVHEIRTFGLQNAPPPHPNPCSDTPLHGKLSFMAPQFETIAPKVWIAQRKFHV